MRTQKDTVKRFTDRYAIPRTETTAAIEQEVIGGDAGANGYTTVRQVDMLVERLQLSPGGRLLDIGAGRGWPGLRVARAAGCSVILLDIPRTAAAAATDRVASLGMEHAASAVRGSGTELPFRTAVFDAVAHSDTL